MGFKFPLAYTNIMCVLKSCVEDFGLQECFATIFSQSISNVNEKVNGSIVPVSFIIALHKIYREVAEARRRTFGQNKMNVDSSSLSHFHASVRIFMCVRVLVPICAYTWNVESYTHPHLE